MIKNLSEGITSRVLHLSSWPSLSSLSQDAVPDVARICALLARRPSVGMFVPVLLRMPAPVAYSLLETLYTGGHIYTDRTLAPAEPAPCGAEPADIYEPAVISFLSRLWKRLTSDDVRA